MSRNEPVIYAKIKSKPTSTRGEVPPAINTLLSKIATLQAENKKVLDRGPPTLTQYQKISANNIAIVAAQKQLAVERAALAAVPPTPPVSTDIDLGSAIISLSFEEHEKKSAKLKLTIENEDLRWFDTALIEKGTVISAAWGYIGFLKIPREVVVSKVSGGRTLQIECDDKGQLLNRVAKTRSWNNVTRAEVVRLVAEENGFGREAQFVDDSPASASAPSDTNALISKIATAKKARQDILDRGPPTRETSVLVNQYTSQIAKYQVDLTAARAASATPKSPGGVVRYPTIVQPGVTDAAFLKRLADLQGFEFFIGSDGLHWHPRRFGEQPNLKFTYFLPPNVGEVIDFSMEKETKKKPSRVVAAGVDPITKKTFASAGEDSATPRATLAPIHEITPLTRQSVSQVTGQTATTSKLPAGVHVSPTSEPTAAAAKVEADGNFIRTQQSALEVTLTVHGDPNLFAKQIIEIAGLGARLSGRYYVHELTDTVGHGKGYTQVAKCRTDGTNKGTPAGSSSEAKPNTKAAPKDHDTLVPRQEVSKITGEAKTTYKKKS